MSTISEKINKLMNAYKDDKDMLETINDAMTSFPEYVSIVSKMETFVTIGKFHCEPDEYRRRVETYDKTRRGIHNTMISNVNLLNKFSTMANLEVFFDGNTSDRYAVGNFALVVVTEMFNDRH